MGLPGAEWIVPTGGDRNGRLAIPLADLDHEELVSGGHVRELKVTRLVAQSGRDGRDLLAACLARKTLLRQHHLVSRNVDEHVVERNLARGIVHNAAHGGVYAI